MLDLVDFWSNVYVPSMISDTSSEIGDTGVMVRYSRIKATVNPVPDREFEALEASFRDSCATRLEQVIGAESV